MIPIDLATSGEVLGEQMVRRDGLRDRSSDENLCSVRNAFEWTELAYTWEGAFAAFVNTVGKKIIVL